MLNGIDKVVTGEMLKVLSDMGHGDVLVIVDANFPGESMAKETTYGKLIRCPGVNASELYKAISDLFPVDVKYSENPVMIMDLTDSDKARGMKKPVVWNEFEKILHKNYKGSKLSKIERFAYYEMAKKSYVIIQTGEERQYGNLMLIKGVIV